LKHKLEKINVLFRLYIKEKSIVLILHPDFDLDGSSKYELYPAIDFFYAETRNPGMKSITKMTLFRNMTISTDKENTPILLSDLSMHRAKSIIRRIDLAINQYLYQEVLDAAPIIMKLYFVISYNSWDLVLKNNFCCLTREIILLFSKKHN